MAGSIRRAIRSGLPCWFALWAVMSVTPMARAQLAPEPGHAGLPLFDARFGPDELPTAAARAALAERQAEAAELEREAALARLQASVPLLGVDAHPVYGTPHFVRSTAGFLTERANIDAAVVVADFLEANQALFEVTPGAMGAARVTRDFSTKHNGVRHLTWQQRVGGIDVFGCELRANVMPDGRLINVSSTMIATPAGFEPPAATLTDAEAIVAAARACGVTLAQPCMPKTLAQGPSQHREWHHPPELRSDEPLTTRLVLFAKTRSDIRVAWQTTIAVKGIGHTYDVIIDASKDGEGDLLYRHDRLCFDSTQPITMRVYTSDSPSPGSPGRPAPDGGQFPFESRTLVTISPQSVQAFSPNHWINDNDTTTLGNNVDAHADHNGDNMADLPRPDGGPTRVFDLPLNLSLEPSAYTAAAVVQMFYYSNIYHDRAMGLGFDEAAGNFQQVNFSSQGVGGDPVLAEVQDNYMPLLGQPSLNNANFLTGADGAVGRCQMYVFSGATPDRDGALDGEIVFHELTHGTSVRLHGGVLAGTQTQAMGEGWSDFVAIAMMSQPTDDPDATYALGGYCTYQFEPYSLSYEHNYYFGIRRFPYSTDTLKNPQTYADIDTSQQWYPDDEVPRNMNILNTANEVHNAGEVWCSALMEVRSALWSAYGFAGNERALRLVFDGMKLSPPNPNFLQSRDAIIQADHVNNGGADSDRLWAAFARRGLGYFAISPAGTATAGIVENYDTPHYIVFEYPAGRPEYLAPGLPHALEVSLTSFDLEIVPGSVQVVSSRAGAAFVSTPMDEVGGGLFSGWIPAAACFEDVAFYISVGTNEGVRTDPPDAPATMHHATVVGAVLTTSDGFEAAAPGWTVSTGTPAATAGAWTRMTPEPTGAQPGAAHEGITCWITDGNAGGGIGAGDVDGGQTILTSPAFDLAGSADAEVTYWRWFSNDQGQNPRTNTFVVEVSTDDGLGWTVAETVGPDNHINNRWILARWNLSDHSLRPTSAVRLRFVAQDLNNAVIEAAIDELTITALACVDPCGSSDFNGDGDFGTDADIEAFFACLAGQCCASCFPGGADFNADGDSGTDADIEAFFRVLAGGSC